VSHATLKLTDCPEGLNMEVMYEGGYNPLSPAHTHIEALIGKMAELARPVGEAIHLSADEVAAMQANALLTAKGAQDLPAVMPVVRMSKSEVAALSQVAREPELIVTPRPIPEMTGDTIKVSRPMPYESTAAQNRAQFAKLMADDQRESLWVRLHTLSKTLESSGVIDLHAQPEAYGTILGAMKAVAEQGEPLLPASAAEVWVLVGNTSMTVGHGEVADIPTLQTIGAYGEKGFQPAFSSEAGALAYIKRNGAESRVKAVRLAVKE